MDDIAYSMRLEVALHHGACHEPCGPTIDQIASPGYYVGGIDVLTVGILSIDSLIRVNDLELDTCCLELVWAGGS